MKKFKNHNAISFYMTGATFIAFMLFVSLKLTGIITWSWWWIAAPLWIPLVIALLFVCMVLILTNKFLQR